MKKNYNTNSFLISLFILLVFFVESVYSQGPPPPPPSPHDMVPIDGGIGFLIASGIAYGAKKLFDVRKSKK